MSRPARHELINLADDAFELARDRILAKYGDIGKFVRAQVRQTGNSGSYLPALLRWGSERVRELVLARADSYVEAFTLYREAPYREAEIELEASAKQTVEGCVSAIRGYLNLDSVRTRRSGIQVNLSDIERSMHLAVKEGLLKLRRQRIQARSSSDSNAPDPAVHPQKIYETTLGRNIDRLRGECGWSFDDLAHETGIDKGLILGHVNRGRGCHPRTLTKYASTFSKKLLQTVTVEDLKK